MKIRIILMSSSCIILSGAAWGQTAEQCAIAPTCAELGYEQKAADCNGQYMLKCPFDKTAVFCGGEACSADYALDSCDTSKGTCSECGGKYKYTACNSGYTLSNGKCNPNDCSGYTLSYCPSNGSCSSCKAGNSTKYTLQYCNSGYYSVNYNSCERYCSQRLSDLGPYATYTTFIDPQKGTCYVATSCTNGAKPCTDMWGECPDSAGVACSW